MKRWAGVKDIDISSPDSHLAHLGTGMKWPNATSCMEDHGMLKHFRVVMVMDRQKDIQMRFHGFLHLKEGQQSRHIKHETSVCSRWACRQRV